MALERDAVLQQIDAVLERLGASASNPEPPTRPPPPNVIGPPRIIGNPLEMATTCLAAIERLAPGTSYANTAATLTADRKQLAATATVRGLVGILVALRQDVEAGFTQSLAELLHADLFSDFLEMAEELQTSGYKDAAAVIAGSVLEEHLRKLALKAGVPAEANGKPRKAESLNGDLANAGVYNKLEQKSVTAWLDLRNKAAHGHYDDYDRKQVASLIRDTRDFLIRHPA